jgi:hypothetical protein
MIGVLLGSTVFAAQASAALVISRTGTASSISGTTFPNPSRYNGITFETGANADGYTLDDVSFLLQYGGGGTFDLELSLFSATEPGGDPNRPANGATALYTEAFSSVSIAGSPGSTQTLFTPSSDWSLAANSRYTIALLSTSGPGTLWWMQAGDGSIPTGSDGWSYVSGNFSTDGGSSWSTFGANQGIQINASAAAAVSEPSTYAVFSLGLIKQAAAVHRPARMVRAAKPGAASIKRTWTGCVRRLRPASDNSGPACASGCWLGGWCR